MSLSTETFTDICIANTYPEKSQPLSKQLNLSICSESNIEQWLDWVNDKKDSTLKLALCSKKQGPVSIDFLSGKKAHRRQFGGGKGQPLVRAMGQLEQGVPKIIDATAGMGGDSYVLASLGFKVQMIERSPIVAALLYDALTRAIQSLDADLPAELQESIQNLSLVNANSADYLLNNQPDVDVIYMDPMYPEKKKKAGIIKVERRDITQILEENGELEPVTSAEIKSRISGSVVNVFCQEGDFVKKGSIIAKIVPDLYQTRTMWDKLGSI